MLSRARTDVGWRKKTKKKTAAEPRGIAAYADLVRSVMAIGDVARKGAATQWALRLRRGSSAWVKDICRIEG